jgi:hypothetical protein
VEKKWFLSSRTDSKQGRIERNIKKPAHDHDAQQRKVMQNEQRGLEGTVEGGRRVRTTIGTKY